MKFNKEICINRFHDCVFIKIHLIPQPRKPFSNLPQTLEIQLTYRFGEHEYFEPKSKNYIFFGITMGKLVLDCHNVTFPEEDRGFSEPFSYEYSTHETEEDSRSQKSTLEINLKRILGKPLEILFKGKQEETQSRKIISRYDRRTYATWNSGTEQKPVVCFQCKPKISSFLRGEDFKATIGIATISSQCWSIEASFKSIRAI